MLLRLQPILKDLSKEASVISVIPERSDASLKGEIITCSHPSNGLIFNYYEAKGSTLPIGSRFNFYKPAMHIQEIFAKLYYKTFALIRTKKQEEIAYSCQKEGGSLDYFIQNTK